MRGPIACALLAAVAAGGAAIAQEAPPKPPAGDKTILLADRAMIDSVKGELTFRMVRPRLARRGPGAAPQAELVTVLRDGERSWKLYGRAAGRLVYAESDNGLTWRAKADALKGIPAAARAGFTPFLDDRKGVPAKRRYKALGGSKEAGGRFALASGDGRAWHKLGAAPVVRSSADEALYGRSSAFWSAQDGAYVCFVCERRGGRRVLSRAASADFVSWSRPKPLTLNAEGEDIWSAAVFCVDTRPPLVAALVTRTAAGKAGPADICLALSRDGGRSFERPCLDAWVRPEANVATWQGMAASPPFAFVRARKWFGVGEAAFYAGGRRYELFRDRLVACSAGEGALKFQRDGPRATAPVEIVTKPFVVAGSALEFNASIDSTGGIKPEILDASGRPIRGYTAADFLRAAGYGGSGYFWISTDPKKQPAELASVKQRFMGELYGDRADLRAAWRAMQRDPAPKRPRVQWYPDWDISPLKGRTVRLRLVLHGADLFGFATVDRPPQTGTPVTLPATAATAPATKAKEGRR